VVPISLAQLNFVKLPTIDAFAVFKFIFVIAVVVSFLLRLQVELTLQLLAQLVYSIELIHVIEILQVLDVILQIVEVILFISDLVIVKFFIRAKIVSMIL
jgi:hypothetical protein